MSGRARLDDALSRIAAAPANVWIDRRDGADVAARAAAAAAAGPLAGWLAAVKGNIDVAGLPTTAACPAFAYAPARDAPCVGRLEAAGAVVVGTTNMDQFATGLVGTRTPHGPLESVPAPGFIAGGSSSGSAVAVAAGLVDVALGTDTAGSGRVPAAMNGIVGLKPTQALVTREGVVPACRSLDCVSVFARTVDEAWRALGAIADPGAPPCPVPAAASAAPRVGVPAADRLEWYGDHEAAALFADAVDGLRRDGARIVEVDVGPFLETARLLYEGPWVAERYAAVGDFIEAHPDDVHPVVRDVVLAARGIGAADAFRGRYRLDQLRAETAARWAEMDVMALPTTPIAPTLAETLADPNGVHARLGTYTNFVNLLDLCAVSVPAGARGSGAPFGLQLVAPAFGDALVCHVGRRAAVAAADRSIALAVVGAHLSGQPLNHQLTSRGARLEARTTTAADYRLYRLPDTTPPKPGLVRAPGGGSAIEVEVWRLDAAAFGAFCREVPPPLGIGNVALADGAVVKGFICEPWALGGAEDITRFGGWRRYLGGS